MSEKSLESSVDYMPENLAYQKEEMLPEESTDEDKNWVPDPLQNYLILRLQTLLEHRMLEFISVKRLGSIINEYLEMKVNPIDNWNCSWKSLAHRWAGIGCFTLESEKLFPNKESLEKIKELKEPLNAMSARQFLKTICDDQVVPEPKGSRINVFESDNDDVESIFEDELFECDIEQIPAEESHYVDEKELADPGDYSPKNPIAAPKACILTPRASKTVSTKLSDDK